MTAPRILAAALACAALAPALAHGQQYTSEDRSPAAQLAWINSVFREPLALAPLAQDERFARAAAGHANYLNVNNILGHYQTPGAPGFTGISPQDRCAAAGADRYCGEVASPSATGVISWMATPFHGAPFFTYDVMGLGVSGSYSVGNGKRTSTGSVLSMNLPVNTPGSAVRFWPPEGTTNLRDSWHGGESPDPLAQFEGARANIGPVIFPVVASDCYGDPATILAVTLRRPDGTVVPLLEPNAEATITTAWIGPDTVQLNALARACLSAKPLFIAEIPPSGQRYVATLTQYTRRPDGGCRGATSDPCVDPGEVARTDTVSFASIGRPTYNAPVEEIVPDPVALISRLTVTRATRNLRVAFTATEAGTATVTLRAPRAKKRYRLTRKAVTRAGRHTVIMKKVPRGRWIVRIELRTPTGAKASLARTVTK